ncbi:MAG: hypothetical protein Q8916_12325 [Bacteroidota bacterium]|nr:hypothetical protein [Bacteroidota bacterium]MDP4231178.1 hypothetical protein [Bacteroidota bacterium]MDP4237210.1 hypothetical protein [Bacteroidota bacterium]
MMENIHAASAKEALERLTLPSIFNDDERIRAYFTVMELGNPVQKIMAEQAIGQYPLEEFFAVSQQAA